MNKTVIGVVCVGAVLGTLAFFGYSPFLKVVQQYLGSPAGTTFNTAKIAGVNMALATAGINATTSSITNSDSSDRIITGGYATCSGLGTSLTADGTAGVYSLVLNIGTSTTNMLTIAVATTSSQINVASSSAFAAVSYLSRWNIGSTLNFAWNATNTAACTVAVTYLAT